MENKSHALAAGAFVLVVAALLIAMAAWLTRDHTEQRVFEISSRESVSGLQPQAGVRYKGVLVGRVTVIDLDAQTPGNVLVRIAVNNNAPVTTATFASLGFQGVTGLAFIQLDEGGGASAPLVPGNDGALARIPMRAGLVSRLTDQGSDLLKQLDQASQRMNTLLAADNQKNLMAAVTSLGQAAEGINKLTTRADAMLSGRGGPGAVNVPQVAAQADDTLKVIKATALKLQESAATVSSSAAEFKRMSQRMNEPDGTLDRIAKTTESLVSTSQSLNASVAPRLNHTAEDAGRAARQFSRLTDGLTENPQTLLTGKGAVPPGPGEPGFSAPAPRP